MDLDCHPNCDTMILNQNSTLMDVDPSHLDTTPPGTVSPLNSIHTHEPVPDEKAQTIWNRHDTAPGSVSVFPPSSTHTHEPVPDEKAQTIRGTHTTAEIVTATTGTTYGPRLIFPRF